MSTIFENANFKKLDEISNNGLIFHIYLGEEAINLKNFVLKKFHIVISNNDDSIVGFYTHGTCNQSGPISKQYVMYEVIDDLNVETIYVSEGFTSITGNVFHTDLFEYCTHVRECERANIKEIPQNVIDITNNICHLMTVEDQYRMMRKLTLYPPVAISDDYSDVDNHIVFTIQEPGEKCHDGGEYGFYDHYLSIGIPGWYANYTTTTCDFDPCGTGFEDIVALDRADIEELYNHYNNEE